MRSSTHNHALTLEQQSNEILQIQSQIAALNIECAPINEHN